MSGYEKNKKTKRDIDKNRSPNWRLTTCRPITGMTSTTKQIKMPLINQPEVPKLWSLSSSLNWTVPSSFFQQFMLYRSQTPRTVNEFLQRMSRIFESVVVGSGFYSMNVAPVMDYYGFTKGGMSLYTVYNFLWHFSSFKDIKR